MTSPIIRLCRPLALLFVALIMTACSGSAGQPSSTITRDTAIAIARRQISFEPTSTTSTAGTRHGRPAWIVTLSRVDGSAGGVGLFAEVAIDKSTGEVVTIALA
jgi:hypothetical protein